MSDRRLHGCRRVKPDAGLFSAYDEIFFKEMATIRGLTKGDVEDIHRIITQGEGGHLNQGRYHRTVFNMFFKDREWGWPEFEKWEGIFLKLGEYPGNWCNYRRQREDVKPSEIVGMLRVSELKELLRSAGISYPDGAKKAQLIDTAATPASSQAITSLPVWPAIRDRFFEPPHYALYGLLMRTISFRAKDLSDRRRQIALGMTSTLVHVFPADQKFAHIALVENPDALPPLYPGHMSYWKAEIPGFE